MMKMVMTAISLLLAGSLVNSGCEQNEILITEPIDSAAYYVATNGNDNNPGTFEMPWATWGKAFTTAKAGDLVYIRGGEYFPVTTYQTRAVNRNGTRENPIRIFNYPGEKPVLNCERIDPKDWNFAIFLDRCSNWHIKGLEVKNVYEGAYPLLARGFDLEACDGIKLENCIAHNVGGNGFIAREITGFISFINCDSYDNIDQNYHGETANGFTVTGSSTSEFILTGCRTWHCSDDGIDMFNAEGVVSMDSCWSFLHGVGEAGDGNGFKLGATAQPAIGVPQRIVTHCIAALNKVVGFDQNGANVEMIFFNNFAFQNQGSGFGLSEFSNKMTFRNNISYSNGWTDAFNQNSTRDHNSWDSGVQLSDGDFESLNFNELVQQRNEAGRLPSVNFLKPSQTSDLIDHGIDVGFPFSGPAPDLGPFEAR